jgi:hypothetical protein
LCGFGGVFTIPLGEAVKENKEPRDKQLVRDPQVNALIAEAGVIASMLFFDGYHAAAKTVEALGAMLGQLRVERERWAGRYLLNGVTPIDWMNRACELEEKIEIAARKAKKKARKRRRA